MTVGIVLAVAVASILAGWLAGLVTRGDGFGLAGNIAVALAGTFLAPAASADPHFSDPRYAAPAATAETRQDLRSPDTRDAAVGRGTWSVPDVTVVKLLLASSVICAARPADGACRLTPFPHTNRPRGRHRRPRFAC